MVQGMQVGLDRAGSPTTDAGVQDRVVVDELRGSQHPPERSGAQSALDKLRRVIAVKGGASQGGLLWPQRRMR